MEASGKCRVPAIYILIGAVLCASAGLQAHAQDAAPASESPARGIYENLELGFKLCANHVLRRGHLSREHENMLAEIDVRLVAEVPQEVEQNTGPLFAKNPIFAVLGGVGGGVYISTAKDNFACRVIVTDTRDALRQRVKFVDALRRTTAWTYDKRRSGLRGGMMRDELTSANGNLVAIMNGPNVVVNDGDGVQAFLTVALIPPNVR